jgi:hypothetical protein
MEIEDFLFSMQDEVRTTVNSGSVHDPAGTLKFEELVFTELMVKHMADIGMTYEEHEFCYFNAKVKNANVRLNGWALSENAESLDLYVSLYYGFDSITQIPDSDIKDQATYCSRFISNCVEGKLSQVVDESHDAYGLVVALQNTYTSLDQIRIYIVTDGRVKTRTYNTRVIAGKHVKIEVMDIERIYNHWQAGKPRDELAINFEEEFGQTLPCLWVPSDGTDEYEYGLAIFSGEILRYLYEKYGTRILQANVRSFLMERGKVNKEISKTLTTEPHLFMAYNNGLVIVADEIRLGISATGAPGITYMKGLQIVNGGQTTASMFFTKRKHSNTDLSSVRVSAKIIKLPHQSETAADDFVTKVARFANLQNSVRDSDLTSNQPIHVEFEKYSERVYCPDGVSRWFYERSTGSYNVMLNRLGKTPVGIKRLKTSMPTAQKISKTDLAKFTCAWRQHPHVVSLGGQKNFSFFMDMVENDDGFFALMDNDDYKRAVATVLLFKGVAKVVRKDFKAFQANITAYTVSLIAKTYGDRFDLLKIWNHQGISQPLAEQIRHWSKVVWEQLEETAHGRMVSEWSKKSDCWETFGSVCLQDSGVDIPEVKHR